LLLLGTFTIGRWLGGSLGKRYVKAHSGEPPRLAVPFGDALVNRLPGLVSGSIGAGMAGAIGWAKGALLPEEPGSP
jgi:hypothetical protein